LKIEKQPLENHEIKLEVEISPEEFEPLKHQAAKKIAKDAKIPGFRPGKAPYEIIRRNYGDTAIAQEALDTFLENQYERILKEGEIEPGGMGRLDKIDQIDPPKFSLIVPLAPTIELNNYREIREEYVEAVITDEEVREILDELKTNYATAEPAEGPAKEGQTVYVLIKADLKEEDPETGKKELIKERPYEFIIGKDTDEKTAWPFVNFSQNFIGAQPNEIVTVEHTYGEEAPIPTLKNKTVIYTTTVQSIKDLVMPAEDLELAKKFGDYETFDDFMKDIRERLLKQKQQSQENEYIENIVRQLVEKADIQYAPNALEEEAQEIFNDFKQRLAQQGVDLETYLKMKNTDMEKFLNEEIRPSAEEQLKRRLVLQEFAAKEKIRINMDNFKENVGKLQETAAIDYQKAKTNKEKQAIANYITNAAMNQSFNDALFDRLIAIAKGENPAIEEVETAPESEKETATDNLETVQNETESSDDLPIEIGSNEKIEMPESEIDSENKS